MPTFTLRPADAGYWAGQASITGASTVWEAVDEASHDSDATRFELATLGTLPDHAGRVSVRISQMGLARLKPSSVTLTVYARSTLVGDPGTNNTFALGLSDASHDAEVGAEIEIDSGTYAAYSATFTTDPFTGAAWARGALAGRELYMQVVTVRRPTQRVRVTAWDISGSYDDPTNWSIQQ